MKRSDKEIEDTLAVIWKQLLQVEEVTAADNFFELGGDSMLALRLISAVSEEFGIDLSFKALFRWPVLHRLSRSIASAMETSGAEEKNGGGTPDPEKITPDDRENSYTPITYVQHYWLDEEADRDYKQQEEGYGTIIISYHILGNLDVNALTSAVAYLTRRHESLRSTFHEIDGRYFMKVEKEDLPAYLPVYKDFSGPDPDNTFRTDAFIFFRDHTFDCRTGPLFLVRIGKRGEERHTLSIKLHHLIYDTWSIDVLLRDLLVAYEAFSTGRKPDKPPLKYQYRDYLAMANRDIDANYDAHRQYWIGLYNDLPPRLLIPGAKKQAASLSGRITWLEIVAMPDDIFRKITLLAKECSIGLFVLLQASFKTYLRSISGSQDIAIGTHLFGRDYPDAENQIGGYAPFVLIRTVFDPHDSFYECLEKVRQSNADMYQYTAFTLKQRMELLMTPAERTHKKCWQINLQYRADKGPVEQDNTGAILKRLNLGLEDCLPPTEKKSIAAVELELIFSNAGNSMEIGIAYDSSIYEPVQIKTFMEIYFTHLREIPYSRRLEPASATN